MDKYRMPCPFSAVFSGSCGPLAPYFYFINKAQKEISSDKSFLREPDRVMSSKRRRLEAEVGAPLAEHLPGMHGARAHLQHRLSWIATHRSSVLQNWRTEDQKFKVIFNYLGVPGNLGCMKPLGEVQPKLYILAFYGSYYSFHFSILRISTLSIRMV